MISEFLEKNLKGFNYGNFIALKIQTSLILMAVISFAYFLIKLNTTIILQLILSVVFFHAILIETRKRFEKDFKYFLMVFVPIYLVIQIIWINNIIVPAQNRMDVGFLLIFILIVIAVVFSFLIKKNTVEAKVLSSNGKITVVETEFDLRSFNKGKKHIIETNKKIAEGKKIEIRIKKGIFGKSIEII